MPQTVEQAIAQATFYTDNQAYQLIQLPKQAITAAAGIIAEIGEPFCALVVDRAEVSLIIPQEAVEDFAERLPGLSINATAYQLITIDVELEPELVGFMERISATLAKESISILTYAAYSRDHFFVPQHQFESALNALKALQSSL